MNILGISAYEPHEGITVWVDPGAAPGLDWSIPPEVLDVARAATGLKDFMLDELVVSATGDARTARYVLLAAGLPAAVGGSYRC